jgi:hypothetical protein
VGQERTEVADDCTSFYGSGSQTFYDGCTQILTNPPPPKKKIAENKSNNATDVLTFWRGIHKSFLEACE